MLLLLLVKMQWQQAPQGIQEKILSDSEQVVISYGKQAWSQSRQT
jgi:hypothetical protein